MEGESAAADADNASPLFIVPPMMAIERKTGALVVAVPGRVIHRHNYDSVVVRDAKTGLFSTFVTLDEVPAGDQHIAVYDAVKDEFVKMLVEDARRDAQRQREHPGTASNMFVRCGAWPGLHVCDGHASACATPEKPWNAERDAPSPKWDNATMTRLLQEDRERALRRREK
jgi:hypothetical protein